MKIFEENTQTGITKAVVLHETTNPHPGTFTEKSDDFTVWAKGLHLCTDANQLKGYMQPHADAKEWANCTDGDKIVWINLFLKETGETQIDDETAKRSFLVASNPDVTDDAEAREYIGHAWSKWHELDIEACSKRHHSHELHDILAQRLNPEDREDFFKKTANLFGWFVNEGIKDVIDWMKNTVGTAYESDGFAQETWAIYDDPINDTLTDLKNEILDVIENGNY